MVQPSGDCSSNQKFVKKFIRLEISKMNLGCSFNTAKEIYKYSL